MGQGLCNCSEPSGTDKNMDRIARREGATQPHKNSSDTSCDSSLSPLSAGACSGSILSSAAAAYSVHCGSIRECDAVKRMLTSLVFYETVSDILNNRRSQRRLLEFFGDYPFLLDDYHHVLVTHFGDTCRTLQQCRQDFEFLYDVVMRQLTHCEITSCAKIRRNYRCRESRELAVQVGHTDGATTATATTNLLKLKFYIDTMDAIHCYFVHAFHCGYRLKICDMDATKRRRRRVLRRASRRKPNDSVDGNSDYGQLSIIMEETASQMLLELDDESQLYIDEQLDKIQSKLKKKRQRLLDVIGEQWFERSKFVTSIPEQMLLSVQSNAADSAAVLKKKQRCSANGTIFGHRLYFWKWHQNSCERDSFPNESYAVNEWYIERKYDDLEEEMHDNRVYALPYERFKEIVFVAHQKLQTQHAKRLMASSHELDKFGLGYRQSITLSHLQSVLIYCHFSGLFGTAFRACFTRQLATETDECVKTRVSEFWHLSKLLSETVQVFGVAMAQSQSRVFYHSLDHKYAFDSTVICFGAPRSLSVDLEVLAIHGRRDGDGILLEMSKLGQDDEHMRYFNCSWISPHASDGERLFFGGGSLLRLKSIRELSNDINYEYFLHAISILHDTILGQTPSLTSSQTDVQIIVTLCNKREEDGDADNDVCQSESYKLREVYITGIFESFCGNVRDICINKFNMNRYYHHMASLFFYPKKSNKENVCRLGVVCSIFVHCKHIRVQYYKYSQITLDALFLENLLQEFESIPQPQQENMLIELIGVEWQQSDLERFKNKFMAARWYIEEKIENEEGKVRIYRMHMSSSLFCE